MIPRYLRKNSKKSSHWPVSSRIGGDKVPFETNKTKKICPECGKEIANLGYHIANVHPKLLERLEEIPASQSPAAQIQPKLLLSPGVDTNEMVRQKLETMLNIKLIQMLEKGASIEDINRMLQPPPQPQNFGLKELKEYHDLVFRGQNYGVAAEVAEGGGFDWTALINAAMQILPSLLASRNNNISMKQAESVENGFNTGEFEEGSVRILKPISTQIAGDTTEPRDIGTEPVNPSKTEQPNFGGDAGTNKGN